MTMTIDCMATNGSMQLEEYIDWVHENVRSGDNDSIVASAPRLYALAQNRELVLDVVDTSLKCGTMYMQAENQYTDAAIMLYNSGMDHRLRRRKLSFGVRAVVWRVPRLWGGTTERDKNIHSYGLAHDHNFNFVTVGYFGPGYKTDIYEYDCNKVDGYPGEHVDIRLLEQTYLSKDKVMFYRKGKDIHVQHPPESMSISLNLLITQDRANICDMTQQYEFDLEEKCIAAYALGPSDNGVSLLELASEIGGGNTADIVEKIAHSDPHPRTRAMAYKAYAQLVPTDLERIRAAMHDDASLVVRQASM